MRTLILSLILFLGNELTAQTVNIQNPKISRDSSTGLFSISSPKTNTTKSGYLYIGMIRARWSYQALSPNGEITYFNQKLEEISEQHAIEFGGWICGTVPRYALFIEEVGDSLFVLEGMGYHFNDLALAREACRTRLAISNNEVDQIYFINHKRYFSYTTNYGMRSIHSVDPRTILFEKDGKFGILGEHKQAFCDEIKEKGGFFLMKADNLYGYAQLHKRPLYAKLGTFIGNLATFESPDGRKGFIDILGREYVVD